MSPQRKRSLWLKLYSPRRRKAVVLAVAAMPLFQATGCFPDVVGALNFELQSLINSVLINTVNIIVQNLLGL